MAGKYRTEMDAAVSRRNSLRYDTTVLNYWNRATEKPMDSLNLCRESKVATSECNAVTIPQTC